MTVIAWDGTTLAADKRATNCGTVHATTKIFRTPNELLAISGCLPFGHAMRAWFVQGQDPEKFPKSAGDSDWALLTVIQRDGSILKYEHRPFPFLVAPGPYAAGSARDFALMAMHLGHDAPRAAQLACELSVECGNGIDTLTFDETPSPIEPR